MKRYSLAGAAAIIVLAHSAAAHDYTVGELVIGHPMAFETAPTAQTGAGYLTVTNNGGEGDRLLEVRADFPKVEMHTTEITDDIARMSHVEAIDIPAGETVALEPGGYHVMFMGLNGVPLEAGEKLPATLVFETAGEVSIEFDVEPRGDADGDMDHSGHEMSH